MITDWDSFKEWHWGCLWLRNSAFMSIIVFVLELVSLVHRVRWACLELIVTRTGTCTRIFKEMLMRTCIL